MTSSELPNDYKRQQFALPSLTATLYHREHRQPVDQRQFITMHKVNVLAAAFTKIHKKSLS